MGPAGPSPAKSGAGCSLENTEILGGDLPVTLGGGGVELEVEASQQCYNRYSRSPESSGFETNNYVSGRKS